MTVDPERLPNRADWTRDRERGSESLLRAMAWFSLHAGRRLGRIILQGVVAYFFLFAPRARRHSLDYLARALGRPPRARDRWRHLECFATCIHDRVYLVNDQFERFEITIDGEALMEEQLATGCGAILMGAHMGSFEMMRSVGRRQSLEVALAMYEENARKIATVLAALAPRQSPDIIPLGHLDAMLKIAERLERGVFVGVLGDRTLADEPTQIVELLGSRARLPTGPMRAAAILRCRVIFMVGLYRGKNRYRVVFAPLADFSAIDSASREAAVRAAVAGYAALLDRYCRSDPYNWFNFFDFWTEA